MITIWHNPRCTKSRQTLALVQGAGHAPQIRLYLQDAPTVAEITDALQALGLPAIDLVRRGESVFKEQSLKGADEATLIAAMAAHPILIERPVVFANGKAAIGRPPESTLVRLGL